MNKIFCRFAPALLGLIFSSVAFGDDFKSLTFDETTPPDPIRIHGDQFMLIRNFTQESTGSSRGVVMVNKPPANLTAAAVLAAATLDKPTLEVVNSVVIAGPADVSFTCGTGGGNCFISYKKDSN